MKLKKKVLFKAMQSLCNGGNLHLLSINSAKSKPSSIDERAIYNGLSEVFLLGDLNSTRILIPKQLIQILNCLFKHTRRMKHRALLRESNDAFELDLTDS